MRKFLARFRQSPVFSTVYVLGAALSVASVMLVAIFLHVKTSNIYPEYSRDRMLYLNYIEFDGDLPTVHGTMAHTSYSGSLSNEIATAICDTLKDIARCAIVNGDNYTVDVYVDGKKHNITVKNIDKNYSLFGVYDYKILEGKPSAEYGQVMISDRLARRIFGTEKDVVGKTMHMTHRYLGYGLSYAELNADWTVCGVFKEGSRLLPESFAEVLATGNSRVSIYYREDFKGDSKITILPNNGVTPEEISETIRTMLTKRSSQPFMHYVGDRRIAENTYVPVQVEAPGGSYTLSTGTYPRNSLQMALGDPQSEEEFDFIGLTKLYGVLVLVLLLVPALNLSSLISGNMDSKMSEMGIRKAFGAKNSTLLRQVLNENLWLTGCGAVIGIILSWIGVVLWKDWLFAGVGPTGGELSTAYILLDPAMLFAPKVFIAAVVICVILNLLSSLIPVWWALRRPAIDAIKIKS